MAKTREPDSAGSRLPPPPRQSGAGLSQMALFGGLLAVVFAFLGVFMASGGKDPNVLGRVDALGVGLVLALTAPEPEWWDQKHATTNDHKASLAEFYNGLDEIKYKSQKTRTNKHNSDHVQTTRNKNRIENLETAYGSFTRGTLRGIQLSFPSKSKYTDHSAGAKINPQDFRQVKSWGDEIRIGTAIATSLDGTTFAARVYHRPYRDKGKVKRGDAWVILSKAAIDRQAGGGMWLFLTPVLVLAGVGLIVFFANNTASGIKSLARDLDSVTRGKLDTRVHVTAGGEIGYLQRTADRMVKSLQDMEPAGDGAIVEAVEKEMSLAGEIHESLRPSDPPRVPGFELETLFKMGSEIGGDYFDYIELDGNRIALVIADCSESLRGVPAAMVMAMTRAYLKAAIDPDTGPGDWLRRVNRQLSRDLKSGMAVTALVAVLDSSSGEIVAASAGHRPIILWRKGKTALINPNGIALGLDVGPVFDKTLEEKRFTMAKNDRIILHTDGLVTAENEDGEPYGDERFMESVRKQGAMNSAAFVNFVAGGLDKFLDGVEQTDDITISTLKKMK